MDTEHAPARRLGLGGAAAIGIASMVGAGVFAVWAPAAAVAGELLLVGLSIAALVALANVGSTAQLAARYPESGGAYRYGRELLGAWPGFLAGWGFVIGKTASCAAMALTAAEYLAPAGWERPIALAVVAVVVGVDLVGITRTARVAAVIVIAVGAVLAVVIAAGIALAAEGDGATATATATIEPTPYGVLQAAGLCFFAFAGYARIATLGEEVVDPARTIPRAIAIAFAVVVVLYAGVGVTLLAALGAPHLADADEPLADVVRLVGWPAAVPLVQVAAGAASVGALLALVAGIGRTSLAMARDRELPAPLARVSTRFGVPWAASVSVGVGVAALLLIGDLRSVIGFSSFGVLGYYLVANLAALRQPAPERRLPRWASAAGAIGCLALVAALPWQSVVGGVGVFAVGAGIRLLVLGRRRRLAA
ncbi:APC family permease [Agromyces sp. LHK192]|uniref:APC family permease n=1 Tax=Agromyces sp. LHK192 TaxID=2498704 RepID=UPI001F0BE566|nr:amino acid permease [Agromyces sp. LHK192]